MGMTIDGAIEYLTDFSIYSPYQEAIDKVSAYIEQIQADYENRLKTDLVAILDKIRSDVEDWQTDIHDNEYDAEKYDFVFEPIYASIDKYKSESEGKE